MTHTKGTLLLLLAGPALLWAGLAGWSPLSAPVPQIGWTAVVAGGLATLVGLFPLVSGFAAPRVPHRSDLHRAGRNDTPGAGGDARAGGSLARGGGEGLARGMPHSPGPGDRPDS